MWQLTAHSDQGRTHRLTCERVCLFCWESEALCAARARAGPALWIFLNFVFLFNHCRVVWGSEILYEGRGLSTGAPVGGLQLLLLLLLAI